MRTCNYKPIKKKKKRYILRSLLFYFFFCQNLLSNGDPNIPQEAPQNYMHEMSLSDIIIS